MNTSERVEALAVEMRGNWRKFDAFVWHGRPYDGENWTIYYSGKARECSSLAESNHACIAKRLRKADAEEEGWAEESHGHWAVGSIDGFAVRVRDEKGAITPAFTALAECIIALETYPALDESDWSEREHQAESDAWGQWLESDLRSELVKQIAWDDDQGGDEYIDAISGERLSEWFYAECEHQNAQWEHSDAGAGFDVTRLVDRWDSDRHPLPE